MPLYMPKTASCPYAGYACWPYFCTAFVHLLSSHLQIGPTRHVLPPTRLPPMMRLAPRRCPRLLVMVIVATTLSATSSTHAMPLSFAAPSHTPALNQSTPRPFSASTAALRQLALVEGQSIGKRAAKESGMASRWIRSKVCAVL